MPFRDQRMPATATTAATYRSGSTALPGSRYPITVVKYTAAAPPAGTAAANETPKGVRLLNMAARGISNPNNAHRAVRAICRLRGCRFSRVVCFVTAFSFNFSTAIPSIV